MSEEEFAQWYEQNEPFVTPDGTVTFQDILEWLTENSKIIYSVLTPERKAMSEDLTQEDFECYVRETRKRTVELIHKLDLDNFKKTERIEALELAIREHKNYFSDELSALSPENNKLWSVLEDSEDD